jgi:hypothetical protein
MKNVNTKMQSFTGIFSPEELSKPADKPTSNSMLNSSFLQGFAARRALDSNNLQV